jgi:murein L,D-transpeptidase YafK
MSFNPFFIGVLGMGLVILGNAAGVTEVDSVVINKGKRELLLLYKGAVIRLYRVALGSDPVGPKVMKGDCKTPEGEYIIDSRNARSKYHLSLHISYPNKADKAHASQAGVDPGGDIMIHGLPPGATPFGPTNTISDWTIGCVAVNNDEIEEIWRLVPNKTPVQINP